MKKPLEITKDILYVGGSRTTRERFETVYPVPDGMAYHSYLLKDEKNVLFDTVDASVSEIFFDNLSVALNGESLDYIVVLHMEPDHSYNLLRAAELYPQAKIVCTSGAAVMMGRYLGADLSPRIVMVKEGDGLKTGAHTLKFFMAPMVHWPEVMVALDDMSGTLFSADAFGSFGAKVGTLTAETGKEKEWTEEARRYYANIVGKYGAQVTALLDRLKDCDIRRICPLHGSILESNLGFYLDKYRLWASYTPEDHAVVIAYGSIYGHTKSAAELLAAQLKKFGEQDVALYDVSDVHTSYILGECFRADRLVFASPTYNGGLFPPMETLLLALKAHGLSRRTVSVIQSGSWAPASRRVMTEILSGLKDVKIIENDVNILCAMKSEQAAATEELARKLRDGAVG